MADSQRVRIFYSGVTDDRLTAYLDTLEQAGFDLEYIVYASDVDPERAEERAAAGEWDAVRATRGSYRLGLEFGAGTGTLDISGITMEDFGADTEWPWAAIPAPTHLTITEVLQLGGPSPLVDLEYGDNSDIEEYVTELEAVGFVVTNRSFGQNDDIISVTVQDAANELYLRSYGFGRLQITLAEATDAPTLPVATREFPEYLPAVPGGTIVTATITPDGGFTALVVIDGEDTIDGYLAVLHDAGWAETGETMLAGLILSDGPHRMTILGGTGGFSPVQFSIMIDPS